jgi:hypothetical protein
MSETALDLYTRMVSVIDRAAADRNIYDVPKAAEQAGMDGGETERGFGQRWEYSLTDEAGHTVKVHCRWWDQSKAFSIRPDKHVMTVELSGPEVRQHSASYEE